MAVVKTDNKHYAAIAEKIRERGGVNTQYKPSEMPSGIDEVYQNGVNEGSAIGYENGYGYGAGATNTERDKQDAEYLNNINAELVACGVAEAEALSDVPQSVLAVGAEMHRQGFAEGEAAGHTAGLAEGKQSEYDRFWDAFQDYGTRTDYQVAFARINAEYIRPKYKVENLTATQLMFRGSTVKKIERSYFDFSGIENLSDPVYALFNNCPNLEEMEDINMPAVDYRGTWYACPKLKKIAVVRCASGKTFNTTTKPFYGCYELTDVTFTGTLNTSGLDMQWSTKLSRTSIESIIGVLSPSASGKSITLSKAAVNAAFETSAGAKDGTSSDAWATLIASKKNWTISLV